MTIMAKDQVPTPVASDMAPRVPAPRPGGPAFKVKAHVVTFYVHHSGFDAEIDVTRKVMLDWTADDLVKELRRHNIREEDVRAARRASTGT